MWNTSRNGMTYGPFSDVQMRAFIVAGKLLPSDFVWKEGMANWMPAKNYFRFPSVSTQEVFENPYGDFWSIPQVVSRARRNAKANRIQAAILAILLGGLGIHKFYLGYHNAGGIMLGITFFSCGLGIFLVAFVGIVEGLIYLSTTDDEFYAVHVEGQREWL